MQTDTEQKPSQIRKVSWGLVGTLYILQGLALIVAITTQPVTSNLALIASLPTVGYVGLFTFRLLSAFAPQDPSFPNEPRIALRDDEAPQWLIGGLLTTFWGGGLWTYLLFNP